MFEPKREMLKTNCEENINPIFSSLMNSSVNNIEGSGNLITTFQTNEINIENSTVVGTKLIETDNNDERYLKAIKQKGEIAILKEENKLIDVIKLKSLEEILKLIGTSLKEYYYDISFGIYSCEEIVELKKTSDSNINNQNNNIIQNPEENYNCQISSKKHERISLSNDIIFDSEQKKLKIIHQGEIKDIDRSTLIKKERKIFENEITFKKEERINQKNKKNNLEKIKSKENIEFDKNKMNKKNEIEKLKKVKSTIKIEKEHKINEALTIKNKSNIANKNKSVLKIKDNKKLDIKCKKNKEITKYNHLKNKTMNVNINNNIYKKEEKNLKTPNRINSKKINKQRNISTINQTKKYRPFNMNIPKSKSRNNFQKNIFNNSTSNLKKVINKNNNRNINIRTFRSNKKAENRTNDKMTIKEFFLRNKDRYNNKTWEQKNEIDYFSIKQINFKNINLEIIKQNPKCIKCECAQNNKNSGFYICENCKGLICGNCSKIHYLKNPEHQCHYININIESLTDKNIIQNNSINNKFEISNKSKTNISSLLTINNTGKIKSNEIIFSKKCKICNESLLLNKDETIVSYCSNCKGNLCVHCSNNHSISNSEHSLIKLKILFIKDNNTYDNNLIPKMICNICQKHKNDYDNVYFCDLCNNYLCEECLNIHNNKYHEHQLYYVKRILIKDNKCCKNENEKVCRQCESNLLNNDIDFRKCEQCNIYLCQFCCETHIQKYKNHNILYCIDVNDNKDLPDSINNNKNEKDLFNHKYNSSGKKRNKNNNNYKSNEKYKSNLLNYNSLTIEKEIDSYSKIINCINCNSKIDDNHKPNFISGNLCPSCDNNLKIFSSINPSHLSKLIFNKYIYASDKIKFNICKDCKENSNKNIIHFCLICKKNLCINCIEKHINHNPDHALITLYPDMLDKNKNKFE